MFRASNLTVTQACRQALHLPPAHGQVAGRWRPGSPTLQHGRKFVKLRHVAILGAVFAAGLVRLGPPSITASLAATEAKPAISPEASAAIMRMGQTLQSQAFSFQAQTLRVYAEKDGELLHIFHTLNVTVRRPDRLLVERNGDDGPGKIVYDGKTFIVYMADANKYAMDITDAVAASLKFQSDWALEIKRIPKPVTPEEVFAPQLLREIDPHLVTWTPRT